MGVLEGPADVLATEPATRGAEDEKLKLRSARSEIIRDILTNGLRSSARLSSETKPYLSSFDPVKFGVESSEHISFNGIPFTKNSVKLDEHISDALYISSTGALAVIPERAYPRDFLNTMGRRKFLNDRKMRILANRMRSSFLVVCDPDVALKANGFIASKDILYLIFPTDIWADYMTDNPDTERSPNIIVVDGFIEREIDVRQSEMFKIPDYESAIRKLLKESQRSISVHAVRLPTKEDVQKLAAA